MRPRLFLLLLLTTNFISCETIPRLRNEKFVGKWLYISSTRDLKEPPDGSMNGQLATIQKLDGTNESYSFTFLKNEILFSRLDNNHLKGISNIFSLDYNDKSEHLTFHTGYPDFEFIKLK